MKTYTEKKASGIGRKLMKEIHCLEEMKKRNKGNVF